MQWLILQKWQYLVSKSRFCKDSCLYWNQYLKTLPITLYYTLSNNLIYSIVFQHLFVMLLLALCLVCRLAFHSLVHSLCVLLSLFVLIPQIILHLHSLSLQLYYTKHHTGKLYHYYIILCQNLQNIITLIISKYELYNHHYFFAIIAVSFYSCINISIALTHRGSNLSHWRISQCCPYTLLPSVIP